MSNWRNVLLGLLSAASLSVAVSAQEGAVQSSAVITVMPNGAARPSLSPKDFKINVNYKVAEATTIIPLQGQRAGLELMVLIDDAARSGLANQIPDLKRFVQALPSGTAVGVAYMQNGRAVIVQNFTADQSLADNAFRMPQGSPGANASPYFCLSDLAKHWPSNNPDVRREVLMVTDGADAYGGVAFDPENPYVLAAIADAQRARVIVHSIFYQDAGSGPVGRFNGQDYLLMVSRATGGQAYYQMSGSPVAFAPYLADLQIRLINQYELGFLAEGRGRSGLQALNVKIKVANVKLDAPEKVLIGRVGEGLNR
ncbi:MAG TPA: hypothetical protein VGD64_07815 [Acidisarcina sp.]